MSKICELLNDGHGIGAEVDEIDVVHAQHHDEEG